MNCRFEPDSHRFFIGDRQVVSVTQALKIVGVIDDTWYSEEGRARGEAVHLACHFLDLDMLDWKSLDPQIVPYVQAYQKFLNESGFIPGLIEQPVYNHAFFYAGILDRTGILNGENVLIDIKSGDPEPWADLQTAGYARCLLQHHRRFTLRLYPNGTYKLVERKNPNDVQVFLAAVAVANWKFKPEVSNGSSTQDRRIA